MIMLCIIKLLTGRTLKIQKIKLEYLDAIMLNTENVLIDILAYSYFSCQNNTGEHKFFWLVLT